jgi:hypothetical protein
MQFMIDTSTNPLYRLTGINTSVSIHFLQMEIDSCRYMVSVEGRTRPHFPLSCRVVTRWSTLALGLQPLVRVTPGKDCFLMLGSVHTMVLADAPLCAQIT